MTTRSQSRSHRRARARCGGLALALGAVAAQADSLGNADFSLRFPAAITRFASYADVAAAGGAQAASAWSSSGNPASAAWPHPEQPLLHSFAPQFTALAFREGTTLYVPTEALTIDTPASGTWLPAAAQILSNHETDRDGLGFRFDAVFFQLQWAKLLADDWACGVNFNVTSSDLRFDQADTVVERSRGETYDLRLGAVHQLTERLRVGLVVDYGFAPSRTDAPGAAPEDGLVRVDDTTQQALVRPGLVWSYGLQCDLYADYQAGVFWNDTGRLWVHRFAVGIDHALIKDVLYGRLGTLLDTEGNAAGTGGFGVTLSERVSLDLAYQYNMFPEIRREFGTAQTFTMSMGIGF